MPRHQRPKQLREVPLGGLVPGVKGLVDRWKGGELEDGNAPRVTRYCLGVAQVFPFILRRRRLCVGWGKHDGRRNSDSADGRGRAEVFVYHSSTLGGVTQRFPEFSLACLMCIHTLYWYVTYWRARNRA